MKTKKTMIWLILETVTAAGIFLVWLTLFFRKASGGMLSSRGFSSLRYYTVLSNLAAGAASLCCVISCLRHRGGISRGAFRFRFVGSVMALTTFLTVLMFFLPIYGWGRLYSGTNFWFHLIFPVLSLVGFFLIPGGAEPAFGSTEPAGPRRISMKETLLPILPVLIYGAFYSINILINGKGTWPKSNDWYGFLHWGWGIGWCIFGGIILATWLAGMLLRAVYHKILAKTR